MGQRAAAARPPAVVGHEDHATAGWIAQAAGRLLLDLRNRMQGTCPTEDLVALADRSSHDQIVSMLAARHPDDAVLSEEGVDDPARLAADRVWIVDPLDGSREFGEGRSDWAVHVALVVAGELAAGAVALPALGRLLATSPAPLPAAVHGGPPRLVVSRTRPPALAQRLKGQLGAELVPMGSAGAKAMAVVMGDADIYAHAGGQYEWDSAAPVAVARAAGLHVSRIDGSPLRYNQPDPWLPDVLICRPELASAVVASVRTEGLSS